MDEYVIEGTEVVEGEAKQTGNGAHVYVPKDWRGAPVKVVRTGAPRNHTCNICGSKRGSSEWNWTDESGGSYLTLCGDCVAHIISSPDHDTCVICRDSTAKRRKSEHLMPMIESISIKYRACDECRREIPHVLEPTDRAHWL